MNHYEEKQEERRKRYLELAESHRDKAGDRFDQAWSIGENIPFGQPILVGHHSEKRHRADLARIESNMDKGCAHLKTAEYYQNKAAGVGGGGISSDDPDAVDKLREKLEKLQQLQQLMKDVNRAIRKGQKENTFQDRGMSDQAWEQINTPNYCGAVGYMHFELTNNNANIRRIRKRLEQLEQAKRETERADIELDGLTIRESKDLNRVMLIFDGKPPAVVRAVVKSHGFRWMRSELAWTRHLNEAGRYAARSVARELGHDVPEPGVKL